MSSILTISILFKSYFKAKLKMQAANTIIKNIITQYIGFISHNLVAMIDETIPTTYDTNVIIPFDIGSLIGYVISVQKLYPTDVIGKRKNPKNPILKQTKYILPVSKVRYIPIAEINEPMQITLIAFKKHLYLSRKTDIKNDPNTPEIIKLTPIILAALELKPYGTEIGLITVAKQV